MPTEKLTEDETAAEALRVAERWLVKQGWKFTPADVGTRAAEVLKALRAPTPKDDTNA